MIQISGWGMNGGGLETVTKLPVPMVQIIGEGILEQNENCVVY